MQAGGQLRAAAGDLLRRDTGRQPHHRVSTAPVHAGRGDELQQQPLLQVLRDRRDPQRVQRLGDRVLIDRKTLIEKLQKGKQVLIGTREALRASTFNLEKNILLVKNDNREWVSTGQDATQDYLENVPVF